MLASFVSLFLVVTYARHFVGWRFAVRTVAPVQLVYLVLFSASFILQGYTTSSSAASSSVNTRERVRNR